jgi:hypothetical protein
MMKILKAKTSHPKKQIFPISELTLYKVNDTIERVINGEEMIDPIQVIKHETFNVEKMGAQGIPYKEKNMECMER